MRYILPFIILFSFSCDDWNKPRESPDNKRAIDRIEKEFIERRTNHLRDMRNKFWNHQSKLHKTISQFRKECILKKCDKKQNRKICSKVNTHMSNISRIPMQLFKYGLQNKLLKKKRDRLWNRIIYFGDTMWIWRSTHCW